MNEAIQRKDHGSAVPGCRLDNREKKIDSREWDYLRLEREGILIDSGIPEDVARQRALIYTRRVWGDRP